MDYALIGVLSAAAIALTAALRRMVPAIDGKWVWAVTALSSTIVCAMHFGDDWKSMLRYLGPAIVGAIGSVEFLDRSIAKVGEGEKSAPRSVKFVDPEPNTAAGTPDAKAKCDAS